MNVFITSDLHLHANEQGGDQATRQVAKEACTRATENDVLLLLGDYGNSIQTITECLGLFAEFPGRKLAVVGNHDLWKIGQATTERYQQLQALFTSLGFIPLDRESTVINGIGFVGSIGWYDYSFQDLKGVPSFAYEAKRLPRTGQVCWGDALRTNWGMGDAAVVEQQFTYLHEQIQSVSAAKRIIVGMHHVPTKKLLFHPRILVPTDWRFMNAFLGSERFGQLFSLYASRISQVFCGHIHMHKRVIDRGVQYTSLGGDYNRKNLYIFDPETHKSKRIIVK